MGPGDTNSRKSPNQHTSADYEHGGLNQEREKQPPKRSRIWLGVTGINTQGMVGGGKDWIDEG